MINLALVLTLRDQAPSPREVVAFRVPFSVMVAPGTGAPFSSVTLPVTTMVCWATPCVIANRMPTTTSSSVLINVFWLKMNKYSTGKIGFLS